MKKTLGIGVVAAAVVIAIVGLRPLFASPGGESPASRSPRSLPPAEFFGDYQREVTEADITAAGASTPEAGWANRVPAGRWLLKIQPGEMFFRAPDGGSVGETFRDGATGPSTGNLTLLAFMPNSQSTFCPSDRPAGVYTWQLVGADLVIVRVNDGECHDRAAVASGRWTRTTVAAPS